MFCAIWYHLYNLENMKNTHGGVLVLLTLLHGCFSRFLNYTNGTKLCNASHIFPQKIFPSRDKILVPLLIMILAYTLTQDVILPFSNNYDMTLVSLLENSGKCIAVPSTLTYMLHNKNWDNISKDCYFTLCQILSQSRKNNSTRSSMDCSSFKKNVYHLQTQYNRKSARLFLYLLFWGVL